MPTTIPTLHGKFGTNEYWLTTMRVAELVQKILIPKDVPGWEDLSLEERYQRDINVKRVTQDIAPYFASDRNRFSGALVLAIYKADNIAFEPVSSMLKGSGIPSLYQSAAQDFGFLTLSGEEMLIPIDGQHRAKAFEFAMSGTDDNGRPLPNVKSNMELRQDQVAVILIRFEANNARRIFNKLNRYAKPTAKGDNLITDDDDAMAVLTRELAGDQGVIPARLIRTGSNTLSKTAVEFTTLATFYESNLAIMEDMPGASKPQDANEAQRELNRQAIGTIWKLLLEKIDLWAKALEDTSEQGDRTRMQLRDDVLLSKPVGQLSLVRGFMLMRKRCAGVSDGELCDRLNRIDWRISSDIWHGVLTNQSGRVLSGKTVVNLAALFIAHLGGAELEAAEHDRLLESIYGVGWESHKLPTPVA